MNEFTPQTSAEQATSDLRVRNKALFAAGVFALVSAAVGCADSAPAPQPQEETTPADGKSDSFRESRRAPKIGVMLTSHGDVDEWDEIEPYIRSAFLKNVGVPLPKKVRELIQDPAYWLAKGTIEEQYEVILPTEYRSSTAGQMAALQGELDRRGVDARVYVGYNFMPDFIEDTFEDMRQDGIEEVIMFNKGAQFSLATLGESITEAQEYLEHHPEWDVKVTAVRQFSDDPRFIELYVDTLQRDVKTYFPDVPPEDTCILIASHGLPIRLIEMGDPAVDQMRATFAQLQERMPEYPMYHGFLNDDFFPGAAWVEPKSSDVAWEMRQVSCPAVLMDGRLSFTSHHRATLWDLEVEAREILEEPDTYADGVTPHILYTPAKVILAPQWDSDPGFAALLADLTQEALVGDGDLIKVH